VEPFGLAKMGMLNAGLMGLRAGVGPLNIYSIPGIIWVSALFHAPFVYLFCIGPFGRWTRRWKRRRGIGSNWVKTTLRITLLLASLRSSHR